MKIERLTKQEMFDQVWDWFVTKGNPLSGDSSGCAYRMDMSSTCPVRCAIGIFIPDELYDSSLETTYRSLTYNSYDTPMVRYLLDRLPDDDKFNCELQGVHDDATTGITPEPIAEGLQAFAIRHNLTVPN